MEANIFGKVMAPYCFLGLDLYPWDATSAELLFFERGAYQNELRMQWKEMLSYSASDIEELKKGKTVRMWINTQKEFTIMRVDRGFQLRTTARSHPSGALGAKFVEYLEQAKKLSYVEGFAFMQEKLMLDHLNYQVPGQ